MADTKSTRLSRTVDRWMEAAALELASAAAREVDPIKQRDLTERAIKAWQAAHRRAWHG